MSLTVGLTGGIASGKSTVSSLLIKKGYTVIDADIEARSAVEKGEEAYQEIVRHFGERILLNDGSIDRAELGSIIFHDETERKALNRIVHPAVRKRMTAKKEQAISRKEQLIILDIPLLFESKLQYMCDKTLLVYADEDIQLQRLMQRNQLSEKEAMARIQSQMPLKDKKALADAVIDNNGTIEETEKQLWGIFKKWNDV
ncbi:dephospho-CoA kinase [Cytobacillus firmus]|uniref:dephospho-CoA kinase n=1 Tax=Cytobacillus firmus TaxID=1399 RepID=UPI002494018E|nr:dephospho-CoA kinase [Cytobacillus firmus]